MQSNKHKSRNKTNEKTCMGSAQETKYSDSKLVTEHRISKLVTEHRIKHSTQM